MMSRTTEWIGNNRTERSTCIEASAFLRRKFRLFSSYLPHTFNPYHLFCSVWNCLKRMSCKSCPRSASTAPPKQQITLVHIGPFRQLAPSGQHGTRGIWDFTWALTIFWVNLHVVDLTALRRPLKAYIDVSHHIYHSTLIALLHGCMLLLASSLC